MARNKITSDMINRRLGAAGTTSGNGGGRRPPVQPVEEDDEEEGSTFTPGFVMALLALSLVVGGGTFFFAGSSVSMEALTKYRGGEELVSSADVACKKLWVPAARNGPSLSCYLSNTPQRLCAKSEKKHLAMVFRQYRNEEVAFESQMVFGGLQAATIMQNSMKNGNIEVMMKSIDEAGSDAPTYTKEETDKAWSGHGETLKQMENAASGLDRAFRLEKVEEKTLIAKIKRLANQGYLVKSDFGWFPDTMVKVAFDGFVPPKVSNCEG
jgi:hypothetical protein